VSDDTEDVHAAGGVLDDDEDIQPAQGDGVEMEQVAGKDRVRLRAQELGPRGSARRGAGSMPELVRIFQTVEAPIWKPSPVSSPWIRRYPQVGFSMARRMIRARMPAGTAGRPGRTG
jgi:hypothetical protein